MKQAWIDIEKIPIPTGTEGLRVLLYTPSEDPIVKYRMCWARDSARLIEATHWQPLLEPEMED